MKGPGVKEVRVAGRVVREEHSRGEEGEEEPPEEEEEGIAARVPGLDTRGVVRKPLQLVLEGQGVQVLGAPPPPPLPLPLLVSK